MQALTIHEFMMKILVVVIPFGCSLLYIIIRSRYVTHFVYSVTTFEREQIMSDNKSIEEYQNGNWTTNASEVYNYSGITVSVVLIVVAFILQVNLDYYRRMFFDITLFVVALSSIIFTFCVQFWNCALDRMPSKLWLLKMRKIATSLQVIAWYGLFLSVTLCVTLINSWLGLTISVLGGIGIAITYELKLPKNMDKIEQRHLATK